jgi:hypothetical protein
VSDATEDRTVPESDGWTQPGTAGSEQAATGQAATASASAEPAATQHAEAAPAAQAPAAYDPAASVPVTPPFTQQERVGRGLALALLVIPAGIVVWTIVWNLGFVASIVSWGVAAGAIFLYRLGSKARVTPAAYWGLIAIVAVTVVLSFLAGIFTDIVKVVGVPLGEALTRADFWRLYADNIFNNPDMWGAYATQILMAVAFAALGCFTTFRRLSREARAQAHTDQPFPRRPRLR